MQTMAQESRFRQKLGSIFSGLGSSRAAPLPQKSYEELEHNTFFTADVIRVHMTDSSTAPAHVHTAL